jgi:hypothetical protein
MFKCQECGKKFRTVAAAERAANNGCPGCGGVDVDVDTESKPARKSAKCVGCGQPTRHGCPECKRPTCGRQVGLCGHADGICAICVEDRLTAL